MSFWSRRQWLHRTAAALVGGSAVTSPRRGLAGPASVSPMVTPRMPLDLTEFQPKSMLRVPETQVPRAKFPVIDIHTHLSFQAASQNGVPLGEKMRYPAPPEEILAVMDRKNIRTMVDLTGGHGQGAAEVIEKWQMAYPGRFLVFTEPWWEHRASRAIANFKRTRLNARTRRAPTA